MFVSLLVVWSLLNPTVRNVLLVSLLILTAVISAFLYEGDSTRPIILVTTTSTQDSGLLDALIPVFEEKTSYTVKTVALGTGQSLALGARGEADVVLVHAPELEKEYLALDVFVNRRLVMFNYFLVVGPPDDSTDIRKATKATEVFRQIVESGAKFVSRGDNSGTHILERKLWQNAGVETEGIWYIETGQGMGATLMIASERRAYSLSDQGTYLAFKERIELEPVFENDPILANLYHVMEVNPVKFPKVNHSGARAFTDFLLSTEAEDIIESYGVEEYGQPLFYPADAIDE